MKIHPVTADRLADLANLFDSNGTTRDARATMTHTAALRSSQAGYAQR